MIRAEFVFMLGGEINDEEVEAEQSVELQAGRLQNRGQRDLRAATIAMSQAEKLLTGANTAEALVAERAAVTALQRAFSRDRYILRALATRSQLDPARRLTGSLGDASDWRRVPPTRRRTAAPRCCRICCAASPRSGRQGHRRSDAPARSCSPRKRSASIRRRRRCVRRRRTAARRRGDRCCACDRRRSPPPLRRSPRRRGAPRPARRSHRRSSRRRLRAPLPTRLRRETDDARCFALLALAIAIAGAIDPAITVSGASRARVAVVALDPASGTSAAPRAPRRAISRRRTTSCRR